MIERNLAEFVPAPHTPQYGHSERSEGNRFHIGNSHERKAFIAFVSLVWLYVALRASLVPWVHDECTSTYWFLERETFLPYVALWDAGNHFLSSAIGVLGHKLWGLSLFGSRVGSVLAFPIYAWAVFRIGSSLTNGVVRWSAWSALLACPFLLDFFSLFRGYGLGMAFFLVAVDGAIRYRVQPTARHLVQLLLGFALADLAVLSLLPLWALVVAALGADLGLDWRRTRALKVKKAVLWLLLGVVPLLFGMLLSWEMRRRGLLYHGSLDGFTSVTLPSLCRFVLGSAHSMVLLAVAGSVFSATAVVFVRPAWKGPLAVIAALLWLDVCMRIAMALILNVNYPEDRSALHFVPLAILLFSFAADAMALQKSAWRFAALLLLVLPARSVITANVDHTLLWPEQSVPPRFLYYIAQQQGDGRPLTVGAYNQLTMSIPYTARQQGLTLNPPDVEGFPKGSNDLRIVDERFLEQALPGYRIVDHAPGPGLHLLQRIQPLSLDTPAWNSFAWQQPSEERVALWLEGESASTHDRFLSVEYTAVCDAPVLDLRLVLEQKDGDKRLSGDIIRLAAMQPRCTGDTIRLLMRIPHEPSSTRRVVYFWNQYRTPIEAINGRWRVHRTEEQ